MLWGVVWTTCYDSSRDPWGLSFDLVAGAVRVGYQYGEPTPPNDVVRILPRFRIFRVDPLFWHKWFTFRFEDMLPNPIAADTVSPRELELRIPLWCPLLLALIPSAFLWWRDWRHTSPGHCRKCGYDLTGNESGVCPECGERI